jgi:hypothetical protein
MISRFNQAVRKFGSRLLFDRKETFSFDLDGKIFSQPRLLSRKSGQTLSKAGRLAWFALMDDQAVKICECYNESHAIFVEKVSSHPVLQDYFPVCLLRVGPYVVVEWIEGKVVTWQHAIQDRNLLNRVAMLQTSFHTHSIKMIEITGCFNYINYLKNRLFNFRGILPIDNSVKMIFETLEENIPMTEEHISHPDLTAVNLILEEGTGNIKLIDNELLTQNNYFLIDLFNTHYSFGGRLEADLLEPYLACYKDNGGNLTSLAESERFYSALWYLRLIGSSLQAGAIGQAYQLSRKYIDGSGKTHPLIQLVKEKII